MRKIAIFLFAVGLAIGQQAPPAEKPVRRYPGLGVSRYAIHTSSAEAQKGEGLTAGRETKRFSFRIYFQR
jgi:hypothetical protein